MTAQVVLYTKPGCQLCDEALDLLDDAAGQFVFALARRNVLEDEALFEKYRYLVPVVVIDGIQRLTLRFDMQELEAALLASQVPPRE